MELSDLHICLVGPLAPPAGGMANQTRQLAELLHGEHARVDLVQTNRPYRPAWVGHFPMIRAVFRLLAYVHALIRATHNADVVHIMANSGWSWHLFAAPAIWIAWLRRVPVVVNYRGGGAEPFLKRSESLVRWSLRRAAVLAVPSRFLQNVFLRFGLPAVVVPNIIELARFRPRAPAQTSSPHLLVARNLEPIYDNGTALRAFQVILRHIPSARLTVAGSGPEDQNLKDLARQLGIDGCVRFAGRIDRDGMAALYRDSDLMLNPSLTDNMPNSLLEALASGVPVVSTNVGGIPYLVQDGLTALLVPPSAPEAMANAALKVLNNAELWNRLSIAGLAEVQQYAWPHVAPVMAEVYCAAIGRTGV